MGKVLDLQRELWERVATQARRLGTAGSPSLRKAVEEFEESFPDTYCKIDEDRFVERTRRSDFFLVGDYHTLPRAQLVAAHFVRYLKPKTLGLEIIATTAQAALDAWCESDRPAADLLSEVSFTSSWGSVPTRGYEALLEAGREQGCQLIALDHPAAGTDEAPSLDDRELYIAERLDDVQARPCVALIGDLHLHPMRIPQLLGPDRCLVLHQNHAPYHFALMEEADAKLPALLQVSSGRYVYQNTHPLLVEESCLVALAGGEAHVAAPEEWMPSLLSRICDALDQAAPEPPTVISTFDPEQRDLLTLLVPDKKMSTALMDRLFIHGMSFLSTEGPLILHIAGSNHLAEAAGKWLTVKRSPLPDEHVHRTVHLLAQIRLEAAGFLASLLINPMRRGKSFEWFRRFLDVKLNWRQSQLWYERLEQGLDEPSSIFPTRGMPAPGSPVGLVISRLIGQHIGRCLYERLECGPLAKEKVLDALFMPLNKTGDIQRFREVLRDAAGPVTNPSWRGVSA